MSVAFVSVSVLVKVSMCGCPVKQILIHKLRIKTFYWGLCSLTLSPHVFATLLTDREWEAVERHEEGAGEK